MPRLVQPQAKRYRGRIREGVEKGYGVLRDGKEQKGPNFAGNMIVIKWRSEERRVGKECRL